VKVVATLCHRKGVGKRNGSGGSSSEVGRSARKKKNAYEKTRKEENSKNTIFNRS